MGITADELVTESPLHPDHEFIRPIFKTDRAREGTFFEFAVDRMHQGHMGYTRIAWSPADGAVVSATTVSVFVEPT